MKKGILVSLCLVLCLCLLSSCALLPMAGLTSMTSAVETGTGTAAAGSTGDSGDTVTISRELYEKYRQFDTVIEAMGIAEEYYYQDVDEKTMVEGAAAGALEAIGDPYTFYYTPEEYAKLWEEDEGEYAGVGMEISANYLTGLCTISRVFNGTPAMAAGIQRGDLLYKVEDLFVTADNLDDAVAIMRGTPGTDVAVTLIRDGEEYTVTMTRAIVSINRVDSIMLENQVGLVTLYQFAGECAAEFKAAVDKLVADGAQGIIIDLRDNGGGWVNDAQSIADIFLPYGTVCYLQYKDGTREYYRTTTDGKEIDLPLVMLVNEYTASSSEILTGCLKDRAGATVVGVNTYGKGIVQSVLPVGEEGAGMQVTVAQYYTPNDFALHGIGIAPDVEIEMPEDAAPRYDLGDLSDAQLNCAYKTMLQKLGIPVPEEPAPAESSAEPAA